MHAWLRYDGLLWLIEHTLNTCRDTEDLRPPLACTLCDGVHGAGALIAVPVDHDDAMQGVRHADVPGESVYL